ncbi:Polysaccharide deacetylase [Cyclobacterium xiamenense]|uniref:Polysaccharide deacetylase n=1 Tax=Cyclobacterium xiamenense TaxID=1297121 RepID=A0A1H7AKN8_9BACT|nr:polysaccharide deacetylase family protein [Cyclobacterium xiamenense]SEJ61575.1 Polysaccharide deacetylase [Cyclobacterium xiamenense]
MRQAGLIISLDFELHWGRFDKVPLKGNEAYYYRTREVIPRLLALFEQYQIKATWATVGMLMARDVEEWEQFSPSLTPGFYQEAFSAYRWFRTSRLDPNCLFAPDLIQEIIRTPGQELGSHTFSHYYTRVPGQHTDEFRADLQAARHIAAEKFGLDLQSLVFPRNQYHPDALKIARETGFRVVRTNPEDWFWERPEVDGWVKKGFRASDSLLPLGKKTSFLPEAPAAGFPTLLPASRFFRPYQDRISWLNRMKLRRINEEMLSAARKGEMYHLWWHPHNLAQHPDQSLEEVKIVLEHFSTYRERYSMESHSMGSLAHIDRSEV